ncbi:Reticulon-domain-containing protein [Xylariales sp. AK1849]|nr:Reticulon-domain-containing protein [Xylariales sp. AK1849]
MSGPTFVVMPVQAGGAQHSEQDTEKIASAIQQSLHKKTHPEDHDQQEQAGPLKKIMAHQDSLYKYISWEDPLRTLGSYIGALSLLFGAHYLPLTQFALKAGATSLGVVSITAFASRSFSPNFLTRLQPKEYKQVPESTLNATLKDIHDFIQYAVVQVQRIIFGQDLGKTFVAFLSFTALYWLIKIVPPFWLAVLGLTSLYIAPLVNSGRGREVAHDARLRAGELANTVGENGKALAQDGRAKASELSSKARETAMHTQQRIGNMAQNGKQTVTDLSTQAKGTASDISGATAENFRKLPGTGTNAIKTTHDTANSASSDARQYRNSSRFGTTDEYADGNGSVTDGAANRVYANDTTGKTVI